MARELSLTALPTSAVSKGLGSLDRYLFVLTDLSQCCFSEQNMNKIMVCILPYSDNVPMVAFSSVLEYGVRHGCFRETQPTHPSSYRLICLTGIPRETFEHVLRDSSHRYLYTSKIMYPASFLTDLVYPMGWLI